MAARGVLVSYETIRRWCEKFGKQYAAGLRRRRARTGDKWHLHEVFLKINGANIIYGERSIRTALCSTFWFNRSAIVSQRSGSYASSYG